MNAKLGQGNPRLFLPAIFLLLLFVFQSSSAQSQGQVRIYIGNPDCLAFNVPGTGDVALPLWIEIPGPIGGGTMTLYKDDSLIPEWLGMNFFYPWQYVYDIRDGALWMQFDQVANPLDTLVHVADFLFSVNADPSQYGQILQAITVGRLLFSDTLGYSLFDIEACVSPLCIECTSPVDDRPGFPSALLLKAYPNPFNSSTDISFILPEVGNAELLIIDILGRRVKTFALGARPAGDGAVTWFGDNDGGEGVSTGVYFCRLEYAGQRATIRLVMIK